MDIEKLIEKANHLGMELKRDGGEFEYSIGKKFLEYATALSTLQTENERLRAELEQVKVEWDAAVALVHEWEQYGRYLSSMGFTVPPNWKEDLQE